MSAWATACVFMLAAWQPAQAAWAVDFAHAGPIRIGMSLRQVNRVLGEHLKKDAVPGPDPTGRCFQVESKTLTGVELMFIDDQLARIDVRRPGLRTAAGIGVGDTESAVQSAYGARLERAAHAYIDGGWTLTAHDAQATHGIRFEIENGKVIDFYAGLTAAVAYIEGCA